MYLSPESAALLQDWLWRNSGDFKSQFRCFSKETVSHHTWENPNPYARNFRSFYHYWREKAQADTSYVLIRGKKTTSFSIVKLGRLKGHVDRVLFTKVSAGEPLFFKCPSAFPLNHTVQVVHFGCRGLIFRKTHGQLPHRYDGHIWQEHWMTAFLVCRLPSWVRHFNKSGFSCFVHICEEACPIFFHFIFIWFLLVFKNLLVTDAQCSLPRGPGTWELNIKNGYLLWL